MEIVMSKINLFIIITILFIFNLKVNLGPNDEFISNLVLVIMYVIFILVSLYELGKDDVENE